MTNKNITILISIVLFLFSIMACTKKEVSDFPNLTVTSPTASQIYSAGDTIYIKGNASASATDDAHLLHEVMIEVKWTADSSVHFTTNYSTHEMESFDFDTFYVTPSVISATDGFVLVQAVNHIPKIATKSVPITINP